MRTGRAELSRPAGLKGRKPSPEKNKISYKTNIKCNFSIESF